MPTQLAALMQPSGSMATVTLGMKYYFTFDCTKRATLPSGPTAQPSPVAAKIAAFNAPSSNLVQLSPPSREISDPEVPAAIHKPFEYTTTERNPAGRPDFGSRQVRP